MTDEKPKFKFFSGVQLVFPNDIPEKRGPVFIHYTVERSIQPPPCKHCEAEDQEPHEGTPPTPGLPQHLW